jgi:hypothetical protein
MPISFGTAAISAIWFAAVLATGALEGAIAVFLWEHRGPPLGSLPEGELT